MRRTDKHDTTWPLAGQTAAKHALLRHYLGAWLPIMSRHQGRIIFIDGFAGPGVYSEGEHGSPLVALHCLLEHRNSDPKCEYVFLFNEADTERVAKLQEVLDSYEDERGGYPDNLKVVVRDRPFEDLVDELLDSVGDRSLAPTLAFVDPFGFSGASMEQLQRLLQFDRCELLIYFGFNNINRFATSGKVDEHLTKAFGTTDFTQAPPAGTSDRRQFLVDLYARQLREVAKFPYVQHFQMDNDRNLTAYYLFYATRHRLGLDKMKQAMWRVAPTGDYRFADSLNGQDVLMGLDEVDTQPLQNALLGKFGGQTVGMEEVEDFLLTETPYHSGHLKQKTLSPMQRDGLLSTDQDRKGKFTGAKITFKKP